MLECPSGSASFITAYDPSVLKEKVTGPPWVGSQEHCWGWGGHTHGLRGERVRLGIQRPGSDMKLWEAERNLASESLLAHSSLTHPALWTFYTMSRLWNEGGGEMERLDRVLAVHWRASTRPNNSQNRCQRHRVLRRLCRITHSIVPR